MYNSGEKSSSEYWENVKASWYLKDVCKDCEGLEEFIYEVMDKAFFLLDKFDRNEAFWVPGNKLATYHKLPEFSDVLITRNIEPVIGAWCNIFMGIINHSDSLFDLQCWKILKKNNALNIAWLIQLAWNSVLGWGSYTAVLLSEILVTLNLGEKALPYLEAISRVGDFEMVSPKEWVNKVRENI